MRKVIAVLISVAVIVGCDKTNPKPESVKGSQSEELSKPQQPPVQHVRFTYQDHTIELEIRIDSIRLTPSIANSMFMDTYGPNSEKAAKDLHFDFADHTDSGYKMVASIANQNELALFIRYRAIEYYSRTDEFLGYHQRGQGSGESIWRYQMRIRGKSTEQQTFYMPVGTEKVVFYDAAVNELGATRKTRRLFVLSFPKPS